MEKQKLIKYLDEYLKIDEWKDIDSSKNGLQVDSPKTEVKKIGYAVDATSYIFDKAKREGVDMLIVHHGLFWGDEKTIVGIEYDRLSKLIKNDIALYGAHLPLDKHEEVGNNIGLLKAFVNIYGLTDYEIEDFWDVGYQLKIKGEGVHISTIANLYAETLKLQKKLYFFGENEFMKSIAISSGGGNSGIGEYIKSGADLFITGEVSHSSLVYLKDAKKNILLGGHYETEKIGVELLAHHLKSKFDIETIFLDEKY